MEKTLQTYFDSYFEMFGTPGWKQLTADLEDTLSSASLATQIEGARTERDLGAIQGELKKTAALLTLPTQMQAAYDTAQEEEDVPE